MGLQAMKAAVKAEAAASADPRTEPVPSRKDSGLSSMERTTPASPPERPEPNTDAADPFAELGTVVVEWTPPPEEPSDAHLARFLGDDWTRYDVRELASRQSTDKRAAVTMHRARELYADWRRKEIAKRDL
jgi:hypothetical protein